MDLGGASTQIAFAVEEDYKGEDYLPIKLYGYSYNVYTHSFLCYGKNEAEKTLLGKVLRVCKAFVGILEQNASGTFCTYVQVNTSINAR